ncbi:MAG: S-layer homology domain-containing protein, partial [Anaerotignum sp.]
MKKQQTYPALLAFLLSVSLLPACGQDSVTVMDRNGNSVKISAADKDTYTFKLSGSTPLPKEEAPAEETRVSPFIDVAQGAWYEEALLWCYDNGLMRGTGQNTFSPDDPTNRAMIVSILWRLENTPSAPESTFADVPV